MVKTRKLPSSREKKRYIVVEVISESAIADPNSIKKAIIEKCLQCIGEFGVEKAKLKVLTERYNKEKQIIIVRTTTKSMDEIKKIINMINKVENKKANVRTLGVSGILKKAYAKYAAKEE